MSTPDQTSRAAAESFREALISYRDAATAWLDVVQRLGNSERQIADRLAIGRMILHRFRRFTEATDLVTMLDLLPGSRARGELTQTRLPEHLEAQEVCGRLIEATQLFDRAFDRHAASRERAQSLLASIDESSRRRLLREERRSLHEISARHLGLKAETLIGSVLVTPASDDRTCDVAGVQLISGLEVHRPSSEATIYLPMVGYADLRHDGFPVNLDPDAEGPLLEDPERPSILRRELHTSYEFVRYTIRDDAPLHRRLDLRFGEIHPSMGPMEGTREGDTADFVLPIHFPIRLAVMELWLHHGLRRDPSMPWCSFLSSYKSIPQLGADVSSTTIEPTGHFAQVQSRPDQVADVAVFSDLRDDLLERAAARLEVKLDDFEVFRMSEAYPPLVSGLRIHWRLAAPAD